MLTGSDSAEHVVEGLGAGAEDFVTKGSDIEIVVARLRALLRMKAYQDQLRRMNQQMTRDLQIARRVQEALVPERAFTSPRIEIRSAYIPSEVLSGDFYDYFTVDDFMYLFVADVSGHGLPVRDPGVAAEELHPYRGRERPVPGRVHGPAERLPLQRQPAHAVRHGGAVPHRLRTRARLCERRPSAVSAPRAPERQNHRHRTAVEPAGSDAEHARSRNPGSRWRRATRSSSTQMV